MKQTLIAIFILIHFGLFSQNDYNYLPKDYGILPPSPTVSDLLSVKDFDVDYHQGRPNISFTLYTVKSGDLEIPVTMTYQSGGIRADQLPSNLGLGWTLSASGVIGRNVVGIPDDVNGGSNSITGLHYLTEYDKQFRDFYINHTEFFTPYTVEHYENCIQDIASKGQRYYDGLADMANDYYSVSAPGINATYLINEDGKIVLSSNDPISIVDNAKLQNKNLLNYSVYDAAGTVYTFNDPETSKFYYRSRLRLQSNMQEDSIPYTSALHLTSIKNISGDEVTFDYGNGALLRHGGVSQSVSYTQDYQAQPYINHLSSGSSYGTSIPRLLKKIGGKGQYVTIDYTKSTKSGAPELIKAINVYYAGNTKDAVKKFTFEYNTDKYGISFLSKVFCNKELLYSFNYIDENPGHGIDFGGYPNDKGNGYSNVPPCPLNPSNANDGADRSVNTRTAKHRALNSITYPTGGYTEFVWESHDFSQVNDTIFTGTLNTPNIKSVTKDTLCGLVDYEKVQIANYNVVNGHTYGLDFSEYFEFDPTLLVGTEYYSKHEETNPSYPHIKIFKNGELNPYKVIYIDHQTLENAVSNAHNEIEVTLPAGTYTFKLCDPRSIKLQPGFDIKTYFGTGNHVGGRVYIVDRSYVSATTGQGGKKSEFWPGLRIKEINSYLKEGKLAFQKKFVYENKSFGYRSSGVVSRLPMYTNTYYFFADVHEAIKVSNWVSKVYTTSENGLAYTVLNDPLIEYSTVGVKTCYGNELPNDNSDKYTWYSYTTAADADNKDYLLEVNFGDMQPPCERRPISRGYRRGLLSKVETTDMEYGINKTVENEYYIQEYPDTTSTFTTGMFVIGDYTHAAMGNIPGPHMIYSIGKYHLIENDVRISKTIAKEGAGQYATQTTYTYYPAKSDYPDNESFDHSLDRKLLKKKEISMPGSLTQTVYYSYVKGPNGAYLSLPETEVETEGRYVVSARKYEYDNKYRVIKTYGPSSTVRFSESQYDGKSAKSTLLDQIDREEFNYTYYDNGCLKEISYRGKILASYLWDVNWVHPVAEGRFISADVLSNLAQGRRNFSNVDVPGYFKGYDVTVLVWAPLVGVVAQYDSRGIPAHFEYDQLGRLTSVADHNKYLINRYIYNYQNGGN